MRVTIAPTSTGLCLSIWAFVLLVAQGYTPSKPPFLTRSDLCGIWKLTQESPADDSPNAQKTAEEQDKSVLVIRLNDDGTFDPYARPEEETLATPPRTSACEDNNNVHSLLGRGGCWEYKDQSLVLAADRPPTKQNYLDKQRIVLDTVLDGKLQVQVSETLTEDSTQSSLFLAEKENSDPSTGAATTKPQLDVHLSIPKGQIVQGKFFYPKKHNAFFDQPMLFQPATVGNFSMQQLLGNLNARLEQEQRRDNNNKPQAKYHKRDFYNRTFYLTATPHPVNRGIAAQDIYYDQETATLDIRVMPLTFYPNNTFSAIGNEKILRGRYGLQGGERDRLWFQVSLFGAGRSAPGSVFSEGRLLSQDDRRAYVGGPIQAYNTTVDNQNRTALFVEGEYCYGSLKAIKRNSMGTFTLQEMLNNDDDQDEMGDDEQAEDRNNDGSSWDDEDAFQ
ncbi:expressed unknown protein [Seminavis robusta]|uniref:Uncharacterized protein n=1 Tax=Seminavis robusta TaxID=568900 RepID=A0A9N8E1C0_9STRA|nr:expressed unknown protein [Seminavis robusta]|eukprot:Sro460_g147420.1 n/a (447) ;mRNA; r:13654-14994